MDSSLTVNFDHLLKVNFNPMDYGYDCKVTKKAYFRFVSIITQTKENYKKWRIFKLCRTVYFPESLTISNVMFCQSACPTSRRLRSSRRRNSTCVLAVRRSSDPPRSSGYAGYRMYVHTCTMMTLHDMTAWLYETEMLNIIL